LGTVDMGHMRVNFKSLTDKELQQYIKELKDFRPDYQQQLIEEDNRRKTQKPSTNEQIEQESVKNYDATTHSSEGSVNPYKSPILAGFLTCFGLLEIVGGIIGGLLSFNISILAAGIIGGTISLALARIIQKLDMLIKMGIQKQ
jgi:hypothetical protein